MILEAIKEADIYLLPSEALPTEYDTKNLMQSNFPSTLHSSFFTSSALLRL
jgi:hypothetical protein